VKLTPEQEQQRKKLLVILTDFEKKSGSKRDDIERAGKSFLRQAESFYYQVSFKLAKEARAMKFTDYLANHGNAIAAQLQQFEQDIVTDIANHMPAKKLRSANKAARTPMPGTATAPMVGTATVPMPGTATVPMPGTATATVCRRAVPNEMLFSQRGSPVVMDPRTALGQSKVQAAIAVKKGTIMLRSSPLTDDAARSHHLDDSDINVIKQLQSNLTKMIELSKKSKENEPSTSKD